MQRRAAALYAAFFLVIAVGSYGAIAVAEEPSITLEAGENYTSNQTATISGQTYTVGTITAGSDGPTVSLNYTNESARFTLTIANNSTVVRYSNGSYRALGEGEPPTTGGNLPGQTFRTSLVNGSDNTTILSLTEEFNVSALVTDDPAVENTTLEANGTRYVRYTGNNTTVPIDAYLPDAQVRNFTRGDAFQYGSNNTTIASLTQESATIAWTGTRTTTTEVTGGANVTLGGTQYVAHFPDNSTLTLVDEYDAYQEEQAAIDDFQKRVLGFWGIIILSLTAAGLLVGMAYLPVRG